MPMKYRTIGTTPETRRTVSVLGLGAMLFGTRTDEATSYAILDRYVEGGGTFVDTSNNYAFWVHGTQGGESEALLGRWRRSRGIGDEITVATKLGARPLAPGTGYTDNGEGLSAKAVREAADRSRERLGMERLHVLYAHLQDEATPLEETVGALGELVADGAAGLLGASNFWSWRLERAHALAGSLGVPGFDVLQYHHTYLRRRLGLPSLPPDGNLGIVGSELSSYLRDRPGLTLVAYSPLLTGAYTRPDKPLDPGFDHPGTELRLAALRTVAAETGATVNQVVLAWLLASDLPTIPLVGTSSVAQLEENLAAVDLELTPEQRARLDGVDTAG